MPFCSGPHVNEEIATEQLIGLQFWGLRQSPLHLSHVPATTVPMLRRSRTDMLTCTVVGYMAVLITTGDGLATMAMNHNGHSYNTIYARESMQLTLNSGT